jgi:fimbrial isopeptide formation D2 family protein/uncharacterized repeat protein (TIGR01451 family)/LPXTG-motif cell wall-anchored protein
MRKRFILFDKIVFWLITLMTVMPSFLSAYTAIDVLAADIGIVQTSLPMDAGTASVIGTVNGSGTAVDWVVTVTKFDSEDERTPELELEYSSGLGAPYNISTNVQQINRTDMGAVAVLRGYTYSTSAETLIMTFTTDITDPVSENVSIKMLAATVSEEESGTVNIFSSGNTKTLSLANPIAKATAEAAAQAEAEAAAQAEAEAAAQAEAEAVAQAAAESIVPEGEVIEGEHTDSATESSAVQESPDPVVEEVVPVAETPAPLEDAIAEEPWIKSDLDDYPPGGLVTLTGAGWTEDVKINIVVDDISTDPQSWRLEETIAVSEDGTLEFSFNLPDWFVANYKVTATGLTTGTVAVTEFTDSAGSYSIDYSAYNPISYNFRFPTNYASTKPVGRASNPMPNTNSGQTIESLNPQDLALGQIVPYEAKITVNGSTEPENGTIQMTFSWDTVTQSGALFGFDPAYKIFAAFVDYGDTGNIDPEQDATVTSITNSPLNGTKIQETVTVTGLDSGDTVIVEIWVVLQETLPPGANSNVQTQLVSADTVATPSANITKSAQTVPLNQVAQFRSATADVSITKSDAPDPIYPLEELTYTITVTNHSTTTVANGIVVTDTLDPNVTFVSASDSGTHVAGLVSWLPFSLEPLASRSFTVTVEVNADAPTAYDGTLPDDRGSHFVETTLPLAPTPDLLNLVRIASMITSDPDLTDNAWREPTNVLPLKSIMAYKIWSGGPESDHVPVLMALYRQVGTGTPELVTGVTPTINPTVGPADMFTYTWTGLETYSPTLDPYIYTVDEVNELGEPITIPNYVKTFSEDRLTITNTYQSPDTDVNATKRWVNGPEDKPAVYFQLYRKAGEAGTEETVGTPQLITDVDQSGTYDVPVAFGLQDETNESGVPYIYYVDEVDASGTRISIPGFTKTISEDGLTVTNTFKPSLVLTKVDIDGVTPLAGAKFVIYSGDLDGPIGDPIQAEQTTDASGKVTFAALEDGTYWIAETQPPSGYNWLSQPIGPFIVAEGAITGPEAYTPVQLMDETTGLFTGNYSITVENRPLTELPQAGGFGIFPFIGLGIGLMALGIYTEKRNKKRGSKKEEKKMGKINRFISRIVSFLMLLTVVLPVMASASEITAIAPVGGAPTPPASTAVTIHKIVGTGGFTLQDHDGLPLTAAEIAALGTGAVENNTGVIFSVWELTDITGVTLANGLDETEKGIIEALTDAELTIAFGTPTAVDAGIPANFESGYYYVRETTKPATLESQLGVPFFMELPVLNEAGDAYLTTLDLYPKNTIEDDMPVIDKDVETKNQDDGGYDVGQNFDYLIYPKVPQGIEDYTVFKITDTLDSQLTYLNTVTVTYNGVTFIPGTDYILDETLINGFSVAFTAEGLDKLALNRPETETLKDLEIKYQAEINNTATMGTDIYNNATLDYNNGYITTSQVDVDEAMQPEVHTGGRQFIKVDNVTGNFNSALAGAEFVVKNTAGEYMLMDSNGHITWVATAALATKLSVDATTGAFEVKGLAYGDNGETFTYTLEEFTTPAGYVTMNPVSFEINETSYGDGTVITDNQIIRNAKRPMIPQTGGIGTALFTVAGLAMMTVAVVALKKKEEA